ncbi:MAG: iron ABC transporter permease [Acidobacteria bacterium]|nr:iron ABC transporter permease [Acidobacteriota bacterium]MBI3425096.1 iron ABC transporter permease [Acidobacteriota bacterium]
MNPASTAKQETRAYLTRRRAVLVLTTLVLALLGMTLLALTLGPQPIAAGVLIKGLAATLFGQPAQLSPEHAAIIFDVRLPRIGLALAVGAALALAGAAFQALLRNPLADPHVLGISSGAALGAIAGIVFAQQLGVNLLLSRSVCGFAGALLTSIAVYRLGRREDDPARLVLAGVIVSVFLSSLTVLTLALVNDVQLRSITLWLLGDLASGTVEGLLFVAATVVVCGALLTTQARALNLLMIGERDAFALGVETARVRWLVFAAASLLTGAAVSTSGSIGYVGLLTPHLVRLAAGADNRLALPASALAGALLALFADTIARTALAPRELPTGAITALLGAPLFIYLLLRNR